MERSISKQASLLLFHFMDKNKSCFTAQDALKAFPQKKKSTILELLSEMTRKKLLMRLKEGTYYIIPFDSDPDAFFPEWHVVAACLVNGADHYIGYYSALQIHSLITQPALKEQIVVNKQIKPSQLIIKEIPFQFIYMNEQHFFGNENVWIDSFNKVSCSSLEKTFIDCLYKPEYAGGITEITKALYKTREKIDYDKLFKFCVKFQSIAVIKRMGYLLDLLEIKTSVIKKFQNIKSKSYIPLEPSYSKEGKIISKWNIIENIDKDSILSPIYS